MECHVSAWPKAVVRHNGQEIVDKARFTHFKPSVMCHGVRLYVSRCLRLCLCLSVCACVCVYVSLSLGLSVFLYLCGFVRRGPGGFVSDCIDILLMELARAQVRTRQGSLVCLSSNRLSTCVNPQAARDGSHTFPDGTQKVCSWVVDKKLVLKNKTWFLSYKGISKHPERFDQV